MEAQQLYKKWNSTNIAILRIRSTHNIHNEIICCVTLVNPGCIDTLSPLLLRTDRGGSSVERDEFWQRAVWVLFLASPTTKHRPGLPSRNKYQHRALPTKPSLLFICLACLSLSLLKIHPSQATGPTPKPMCQCQRRLPVMQCYP